MVNAVDNVWDVLQKEVPTRIDELISSLNTCATNVTAIRALLSSKAQEYNKLDQFNETKQVMNANKEMLEIESYLYGIIGNLNNLGKEESSQIISDIVEDDNGISLVEDDEDAVEEEIADEKTDSDWKISKWK